MHIGNTTKPLKNFSVVFCVNSSIILEDRVVMRITLSLTQQCNLACHYCYAGRSSNRSMSLDTARKIIDFAFSSTTNSDRLDFNFFGGEPFLRFRLIRDITNYIRGREREGEKTAQISITTNGTILTEEIINFVREKHIDLCFSIDGASEVHDRNRIYKNGNASSKIIFENLRRALDNLDSVQVNAVYGPDTLPSLPQSVRFLFEMGAPVIHLNPNIKALWNQPDANLFPNIYAQIGDYYIQCYQSGKEIAVNLIDNKIILFLKGGYAVEDLCSMGEREWGFAPGGNTYPCERFIGEDINSTFCLGNIHSGLDIERQKNIIEQRGNSNQECQACNLSHYCMNWCGCTNYFMTGHTNLVSPTLCASERAAINTARHVLQTLTDIRCDLFIQHFMRYLH